VGARTIVSYQTEIDQLDRDLRKLLIDFERFFNGALPVPPEDDRQSIEGRIRALRGQAVLPPADHFRLGALEARFSSFSQLYRRRLVQREVGSVAAAHAAHGHSEPATVEIDERLDQAAVLSLFRQLGSRGAGDPELELEAFRAYLGRQFARIRERSGCTRVAMRVVEEDGRMRLRARPLGRAAPRRKGGELGD
jgi:hypothetical protein